MQKTDLVTIATFPNSHEAGIAQAALEASGIEAFVNEAATNTTLSHVGSALGGVKLQVSEAFAETAREELRSLDDESEVPAWICSKCKSEVDAGFQSCWSCGNAYSPDQAVSDAEVDSSSNAATLTGLERTDAIATRAWRAALLGICFAPLLIYSIVIVLPLMTEPISKTATRKFYGTILVTSVMFWVWYMMFTGGFWVTDLTPEGL